MNRVRHWLCPHILDTNCPHFLLNVVPHIYYIAHHWTSPFYLSKNKYILVKKIPQSVSKIVQHCTEHDRRYQIYCPMHESLCCLLCISEIHNECVGLLAIENIIKTAKHKPSSHSGHQLSAFFIECCASHILHSTSLDVAILSV
jgi:hypothetical protein